MLHISCLCGLQERQFSPVQVKALQRSKEDGAWRYLMVWRREDGACSEARFARRDP